MTIKLLCYNNSFLKQYKKLLIIPKYPFLSLAQCKCHTST